MSYLANLLPTAVAAIQNVFKSRQTKPDNDQETKSSGADWKQTADRDTKLL